MTYKSRIKPCAVVLSHDAPLKATNGEKPAAYMVVSKSAKFTGLYENAQAAFDLFISNVLPDDAEFYALVPRLIEAKAPAAQTTNTRRWRHENPA